MKKNIATIPSLLLIDDDPIYLYGTQRLIDVKNMAKTVITLTNGQDGLGYLQDCLLQQKEFPSLVLVDILMPVMDGWQFLDGLQKMVAHVPLKIKIPVVMVSSSINHEDMAKAKNHPMVQQYMMKPITSDNLDEIAEIYWRFYKN